MTCLTTKKLVNCDKEGETIFSHVEWLNKGTGSLTSLGWGTNLWSFLQILALFMALSGWGSFGWELLFAWRLPVSWRHSLCHRAYSLAHTMTSFTWNLSPWQLASRWWEGPWYGVGCLSMSRKLVPPNPLGPSWAWHQTRDLLKLEWRH